MKVYGWSRSIPPSFLTLALYERGEPSPPGKYTPHPLNRRLGGYHDQCGRSANKNLSPLTGMEPTDSPARYLINYYDILATILKCILKNWGSWV
jgi:hypothetical protein